MILRTKAIIRTDLADKKLPTPQNTSQTSNSFLHVDQSMALALAQPGLAKLLLETCAASGSTP